MNSFDQEAVDKILKDNQVELSWEEIVYVHQDESEHPTGQFSWSFSWKHGSWQLPYHEVEKELAEFHTAMFIYLWLKGVGLPLSDELAYLYTNNLSLYKKNKNNVGET